MMVFESNYSDPEVPGPFVAASVHIPYVLAWTHSVTYCGCLGAFTLCVGVDVAP